MPRYFFKLTGSTQMEYTEAHEFPTLAEAEQRARQVAGEVAREPGAVTTGKAFVLLNDQECELLRVPLQEAGELPA